MPQFVHLKSGHRASQVALVVKNLPAYAGDIRDVGSIPESGRSPGQKSELIKINPLWISGI